MRLDGWTSIRSEIFDSTIRQTILHLANISLLMQFGKGRVNLCVPNLITCLLPSEDKLPRVTEPTVSAAYL